MERVEVTTRERQGFYDITSEVQAIIRRYGVQEGICVAFCPHTTAGVTLNENWDPAVREDILRTLNQLVPWRGPYRHVEGNSAAHIKASLLGHSIAVMIRAGTPALGTWQGIYLAEFDGPRQRRVLVHLSS